MSNHNKKLNVVIAGGSLGGLIHGIVLKRHGHNVRVLERNLTSSMSGLGAGLSSNADMVKFMDEYDLTRQPYSVNTVGVQVLDRHGNEDKEKKWPSGYVQRSTNWDTLYWRMRANFDGLENAYCEVPDGKKGDGEVWYMDGCTVENVEDGGEGKVVVVYTEGGEEKRKIDADLVIATDGPSSKIRQILQPDVERKYVGYCGWRGTVHEKVISAESKEALSHIPTLCPIGNSCTVSYPIPGPNGSLEPGNLVYNWVWYRYYSFNSEEYKEIMTDNITNTPHRYTLPLGRLLPEHGADLKARAEELLAPCVAELIRKTAQPFIQAITDLVSPRAAFWEGKVLLAGDAFATLRPMSGLGINSAARSALRLLEVLQGEMSMEEWEQSVLEYAKKSRQIGINNSAIFSLAPSAEEAEQSERMIGRLPGIKL